jgi:signal transduction histidine kinase
MENQNPSFVTTLSDWEVVQFEISAVFGEEHQSLSGYKALLRSDTGGLLNVCKLGYTPMSNASFVRSVERFSEVTQFPIEAVYELEGGRKMLGFLKCTETFEVGGFTFSDHLMIGNSHDGSTTFFVGNSNMMIRCKNRFARQFRSLKVKHSHNLEVGVERIQEEFSHYRRNLSEYYKSLNAFAKVEVSREIHDSLVARIANLSREERLGREEISTRKRNIITSIEASLKTEMEATGFNLFGLFNGLTHYTSHVMKNTSGNELSMFNRAEKINAEGFTHCRQLASGHQILKATDLDVFSGLIA